MGFREHLIRDFENWSGEKVKSFSPLPASGSIRKYFRITGDSKTAVGAYNPDQKENNAFVYLTKHFKNLDQNVPQIFSSDLKNNIYLLEDLGDQTLFSLLESTRNENNISGKVIEIYKKVVNQLPYIQITASKKLDYSKCYPRAKFDRQSMQWDLNYFKYYFLKAFNISFNEDKLEDDFKTLINFLLHADCNYFMYRDLNSRNIMIKNGEPYFIDYQGGRKGALQYDIASLLFDSKANLPHEFRNELLEHYISSVKKIKSIDKKDFLKYYDGYLLIRLLQMFGAYGYRGIFEGKAHFLKSIPFAVKNLGSMLNKSKIKNKIKELHKSLEQIISSSEIQKYFWEDSPARLLTVRINSFSYRQKFPVDLSGNGGGFVFDCRAIPNPGRYDEYKALNGKDKPVKDFLDAQQEAQNFLKETFDLVDKSVDNYISQKWTDLMINYGCTGGQHRSVYSAERLADHLKNKFDNIKIILKHTNLEV